MTTQTNDVPIKALMHRNLAGHLYVSPPPPKPTLYEILVELYVNRPMIRISMFLEYIVTIFFKGIVLFAIALTILDRIGLLP